MRIWFDTEFIEDGRTIDLLSIGAVREDGLTYYAESYEADKRKASEWVKTNVLPHLGKTQAIARVTIAKELIQFAGNRPEFWAYYADYDWVALCQLFGTMMDLPKGWPMYCRDVKQMADERGNPDLSFIPVAKDHHALADALWCRSAWNYLTTPSA